MSTVDMSGSRWRKSSFSSGNENAECVELAVLRDVTAVRDSKNPVAALAFPSTSWSAFLERH
ncbi:uncharacterized protein DUF397 [Herbihabitans rhizosphaerae]|uniref:Uncharacterized protein DUF397 n=1 Tax=Herbihabitans rhizosphaerae TaxID=1872711 RepID=A0A4Q7L2P7_9PSEU|nr:DUF397 domain-containing protein [Herbihabitans rhizosphaerae]RZS43828.1 uncharacterized protein DUF397 [Herbihabitans rhizosphaerae]